MQPKITRIAVIVALVPIILGADFRCSYDDSDPAEDFETSLVLRDAQGAATGSFRVGATIVFELQVHNRSDFSSTLTFNDTRQYDFVVFDAGQRRVRWKWSEGRTFAQSTTDLHFAPRETKSFRVEWNQLTRSGAVLDVGAYDARGALVFSGFDADPQRRDELGSPLQRFAVNP
jgi:hypothetical protein